MQTMNIANMHYRFVARTISNAAGDQTEHWTYEASRQSRQFWERHVRGRYTRRPAGRRFQPHGMGASGPFGTWRWTERCSSRHSVTWPLRDPKPVTDVVETLAETQGAEKSIRIRWSP